MADVFEIQSSGLPESTRVAGLRGTEGISKLSELELYLLMGPEGQDVDLADALGAKATLKGDHRDGRPPFVFHGIFAAFELVREIGGGSLFHATLVPELWQLTQTMHSRVFTDKSIPDIVKEVLEEGGLSSGEVSFRLARTYPPEEHVCQYGESDLDFISRWMEREGIYYFFEHTDGADTLVITDDKSFHQPYEKKPVRFFPLTSLKDTSRGEALHTFTCKHKVMPASVSLADYDYNKPTLEVSGTAPVSNVGLGEIRVHGQRFFTPDDGKRLAKIRAEALVARQVVFRGSGTAFHLRSGYEFELEEHPRAGFDQKYLVTEVVHYVNQAASAEDVKRLIASDHEEPYFVEVTAIPKTVQFRAEAKTAWPRIYGFEAGTVCGPADSDYAQIDEHGRYKVKLAFDESDLRGGKASTWVRMLQPHGGNPEGWHFPLRKGTEVLLTFLGGDPDRPVIAGAVPNARTPSPVTKTNQTRNIIRSGGLNKLEMEDKKGGEWAELSSPSESTYLFLGAAGHRDHNFVLNTEGTGHVHTHDKLDIDVEGTLTENVTKEVEHTYKDTVTQEYAKHHEITVKSGGRTEEVKGGYKQTIEGGVGYDQKIGPLHHVKVEGPYNLEARSVTWDIEEKVDITCEEWNVTQKGEVSWENLGNIKHTHAGNTLEVTMGTATEAHLGLKTEVLVGGKVELAVAAAFDIKIGAMNEATIGAKTELVVAAQAECNVGPKVEAKTAKVKKAEAEAVEVHMKKATASIKELQAAIFKHGILVNCSNATFFT